MAKILYLTNGFGTPEEPNSGAAARHYYHAMALADAGHVVTVVTANATAVGTQTTQSERQAGPLRILYAQVGKSPKKSPLSRISYFARFSWAGIGRALGAKTKFDVVIASSPPIFVVLQGWLLSLYFRAKLVVDVRDLWGDAVETVPFLLKPWQRPVRNTLIGINRWLERFLYRRGNLLFGSSKHQTAFLRELAKPDVSVFQASNGFDPLLAKDAVAALAPDFMTELREKYRHVVLFAGKHTAYTDLNNVLNASQYLPNDVALVLLGGGYTKAELQERAKAEGLTNVIFHEPVSKQLALRFMAASDVLLINYSPELAWSKTVPGKFYDYLYFNVPIVAAALPGEMTDLMKQAGTDFVVPPRAPKALAEMLHQVCSTNVETRNFLEASFDRSQHAFAFASRVSNVAETLTCPPRLPHS